MSNESIESRRHMAGRIDRRRGTRGRLSRIGARRRCGAGGRALPLHRGAAGSGEPVSARPHRRGRADRRLGAGPGRARSDRPPTATPRKRAIVAVVDVSSQAYGRREEAFGIHEALAGAAGAYAKARQAGHPVIA